MIKFNYLDEEKSTEYIWFESANLYQTVAMSNHDGTVNLKVVFHNGPTYIYYNVKDIDYSQLKVASSSGKAFDLFIGKKVDNKPKYMYKRISDSDITVLNKQMEELKQRAFEEAEARQKEAELPEPKEDTTTGTVEVKNESNHVIELVKHSIDIKYDTNGNRMLVFIDGEEITHFPCPSSNDYARLALFLAPIVSHLGYPIKIGVGD